MLGVRVFPLSKPGELRSHPSQRKGRAVGSNSARVTPCSSSQAGVACSHHSEHTFQALLSNPRRVPGFPAPSWRGFKWAALAQDQRAQAPVHVGRGIEPKGDYFPAQSSLLVVTKESTLAP